MEEYNKNKRGSEWRKWDLHIHSPFSELNNGVEKTSTYRFEYVNDSIEHTFPKNTEIKEILFQQGIKEHVCDIHEEENEAFKQREKKYAIS